MAINNILRRGMDGLEQAGKAGNISQRVADKTINPAIDKGIDGAMNTMRPRSKDGGNGLTQGLLNKGQEKNFTNAYTGFKPSTTATVGGTAAFGGYGAIQGNRQSAKAAQTGFDQMGYRNGAPIMAGDGVARNGKSNAPTLGATGDMVLDMHKGRTGGS